MKKIKIEIPLDFAVEIATYGESGTISRMAQMSIEKELKRLGYERNLIEAREEKLQKIFGNLKRTLGTDLTKKLTDTIETGKEAIKVANRMRNTN